jgi:hypothetical protein
MKMTSRGGVLEIPFCIYAYTTGVPSRFHVFVNNDEIIIIYFLKVKICTA